MAIGASGDLWVTGTAGPFMEQVPGGTGVWMQGAFGGGQTDAYIAHFKDDGALLWATWIGGGNEEAGLDIAVNDQTDRVVVVGGTNTNSFFFGSDCSVGAPNTPMPLFDGGGYFQCACGGNNTCDPAIGSSGFVALFDRAGHRQTVTYLGGAVTNMVTSVIMAPGGDILMAGYQGGNSYHPVPCAEPGGGITGFTHCLSPGWFDLPSSSATAVHYLIRFDQDLHVEWSTYLNAEGTQTMADPLIDGSSSIPRNLPQVAVDESGRITLAAGTYTGAFNHPGVPFPAYSDPGYYQQGWHQDEDYIFQKFQTAQDIYVVRFHADGEPLHSTYFGGRGGSAQEDWYADTGDLIGDLVTQNGRVILAGSSASYGFFPFFTTNNYPDPFEYTSHPFSSLANSYDQYHGFLANLGGTADITIGAEEWAAGELGTWVFPSPATTEVELVLPAGLQPRAVVVLDAVGRVVMQGATERTATGRFRLNVSGLATGVYSVVDPGSHWVARFTKE